MNSLNPRIQRENARIFSFSIQMNSLNPLIPPEVLQAILANQAVNLNLNWQPSQPFFPALFGQNLPIFVSSFGFFLKRKLSIFQAPTPIPQYFPTQFLTANSQFEGRPVKNEPEPVEPAEPSIPFEMGQLPTETYYPTHFMRGTQLHVANGTVKRVEDLSSDDFLRCAAESSDVVVNASVVKAIQKTSPGCVQIVFETGNSKDRVRGFIENVKDPTS